MKIRENYTCPLELIHDFVKEISLSKKVLSVPIRYLPKSK